jgi:hypothetical protein
MDSEPIPHFITDDSPYNSLFHLQEQLSDLNESHDEMFKLGVQEIKKRQDMIDWVVKRLDKILNNGDFMQDKSYWDINAIRQYIRAEFPDQPPTTPT